jgi:uncharacterized membrane protein YagU involved in acid resistance
VTARPPDLRRVVRAILAGGALAGGLDLLGAFAISWPAPPARILRAIAAGVYGPAAAAAGGGDIAAAGLVLHFTIAVGAAAVFVTAARVYPRLLRHPLVVGPLYGLAVFLVMQYVVIPLSAIGRVPGAWTAGTLKVLAVHLVAVGPPIVWAARRWLSVSPG